MTAAAPRLHVEATGEGPVVLLAHGFAGSARNWNPQARSLSPGNRLVRYDARGHARSEAPDDPAAYTPETFFADLGRVLDGTGATRAVVGGLSMGAATALRFALAHPERVSGLVLAAFPAPASAPGSLAAESDAFAAAIERDGVEAAGARFVWGPGSRFDEKTARLVRQGFLEHPAHGLACTLRGVIARQPDVGSLAPALAGLDVPVLIVVGGDDQSSLGPSRVLAGIARNARLIVVPGAGHVVNLAAPAAFDAAVREFLKTG